MNLNLSLLFPEWVATGILLILLLGEILKGKKFPQSGSPSDIIAFAGALLALLAVLLFAGYTGSSFNGMFILDPFASFFKAFFALVLLVIVPMSMEFFRGRRERVGEFYLIIWTTLIGLFFLVSANDLLLLFVSLELVTLSFYISASYLKRDLLSIEAGVKYLILGSLASAFIIFGISMIYVAVGSTNLPIIREFFALDPGNRFILLGILLMISGLGFKIASVPFQLWVPDVYEGDELQRNEKKQKIIGGDQKKETD